MFGKKKNEITDTAYDLLVKRLVRELDKAHSEINKRVEKVICRIGVIELYPEGADKEKAKVDAEKSRESLLSSIATYDDLARQYNEALNKTDRKTTLCYGKVLTSHEIVEKAYKYIYITK